MAVSRRSFDTRYILKVKIFFIANEYILIFLDQNLPMAHRSEALEVPLELNISGETYSGVPTKEQRFGFGGDNSVSLPKKIVKKKIKK